MRAPLVILIALIPAAVLTGCGSGELTEEEYLEISRAVAEAEAAGDPVAAVYEEYGVTAEDLREFETAHSGDELAELQGLDVESETVESETAGLAMNEEDYVEMFVYIGGLQSMGLQPEEVDSKIDEHLEELGYRRGDLQEFSDYVQGNPEVKERVDAAIEAEIAAGEQIMIVEEPLDQQ
jgi:hypothetical protein